METIEFSDIKLFYDPKHDGGGLTFNPIFLQIFSDGNISKQKNICEWCSGSGVIGFSLLGNDYCENLTLIDCNSELKSGIEETIKQNNIENKVKFFCCNNLDNIPLSEKWNIVVSNPPHFSNKSDMKNEKYIYNEIMKSFENIDQLLSMTLKAFDKNFNLHKNFFSKINNYLDKDGIIILIENKLGSDPTDFYDMLKDNGLVIRRILNFPNIYYMLFIMRESDTIPDWLSNNFKIKKF